MSGAAGFWAFIASPFRLGWAALSQIAALNRQQVRSLVTVGFLGGMMSLSLENWATTLIVDQLGSTAAEWTKATEAEFTFLTERMRYTSILQGGLALALTSVILNADRMSVKTPLGSASVGGGDDPALD